MIDHQRKERQERANYSFETPKYLPHTSTLHKLLSPLVKCSIIINTHKTKKENE